MFYTVMGLSLLTTAVGYAVTDGSLWLINLVVYSTACVTM